MPSVLMTAEGNGSYATCWRTCTPTLDTDSHEPAQADEAEADLGNRYLPSVCHTFARKPAAFEPQVGRRGGLWLALC